MAQMGQRTIENDGEKGQSWTNSHTDNRPRMNELRSEPEQIFASRDEFIR
jgi:hypothetical protein